MRHYEIIKDFKDYILADLEAYTDVALIKENIEKGEFSDLQYLREDLIEEAYSSVRNAADSLTIGYAKSIKIVGALQFWNWEDADYEITNIEQLAYVALTSYANEEGLAYDVVDDFISIYQLEELFED